MEKIIVDYDPNSHISEMFKTIRTNIQFMNSNKELRTILITSTLPGEGKTCISINLATAFAQTGKKVVIVDADLRKGRVDKFFYVEKRAGLSNFLSGINEIGKLENLDILNLVCKTQIENLSIIQAGSIPPNPSELLSSKKMEELIEKLKQTFDIIIFDGTPSSIVTDSVIVSRIVDSTIIVVEYNGTKKNDLIKVKKAIENVGGKIAGVIINKYPMNNKEYKEKYYYGGYVKK